MSKRTRPSEPLDHEQLGHLLLRAHRLFAERALTKLHARGHEVLRMAHATLLPHFDAQGTRSTVLAERAGITKQGASQIVGDLEDAGYVTRASDATDGRAQRVTFTAKGRSLLADAMAVKREIDAEFADVIGASGLETLRQLLARLLASEHPPAPVRGADSRK
jgi:DNA-binding MarR family transcriptional regulator